MTARPGIDINDSLIHDFLNEAIGHKQGSTYDQFVSSITGSPNVRAQIDYVVPGKKTSAVQACFKEFGEHHYGLPLYRLAITVGDEVVAAGFVASALIKFQEFAEKQILAHVPNLGTEQKVKWLEARREDLAEALQQIRDASPAPVRSRIDDNDPLPLSSQYGIDGIPNPPNGSPRIWNITEASELARAALRDSRAQSYGLPEQPQTPAIADSGLGTGF